MIYTVEDDENIRELIVYTLTSLVAETKGFPDGFTFQQALKENSPQLIILDLMLPGIDGLTLLKDLRAHPATQQIPVLILSAKGSELDKVRGLNIGADDYLSKPFGALELVARVKALLRRSQLGTAPTTADAFKKFGDLTFDAFSHQVYLAHTKLNLTNKEFLLLQELLTHPRIALSRDLLLETIWGYEYDGESRTVDVHIASLRQKLGTFAPYIETVRNYGYRFASENLAPEDSA